MLPRLIFVLVPAAALSLAACGIPQKLMHKVGQKKEEPSPFGPSGIPPQLRGAPEATTRVASEVSPQNGPVNTGRTTADGKPKKLSDYFTPEDEMVFTDPDNPDAGIPELTKALAMTKRKRPGWELSEATAKKIGAREGKPVLVFFTDSQRSPMGKAIEQELLKTPDFTKWAKDHVVRMRVDSTVNVKDEDLSLDEQTTKEINVKNYVETLKNRYKVLGSPNLLMLSPTGEVCGRYRGYKRGDAKFVFGVIKQHHAAAMSSYEGYRKSLEKKGYREWSDTRGSKIFAKLASYHKGELVLIEPDGTRCRTREHKLSDADKQWIADQKKLRGIQ